MASDRDRAVEAGYVDLYLLPVPIANLDAYREHATAFGTVARELGALSYRELLADDPRDGMRAEEGGVMVAAVVEFASREHRDDVMGRLLRDPRIVALAEREQPADLSRMRHGGFAPFVTV